jgi:hypothetical protein
MSSVEPSAASAERTLHYEGVAGPVRSDLVAAHRRAWRRLASAGTWWSGAARVAIAREVRSAPRCALCTERAAALSPNAVAGAHESAPPLSAAAVEAAHRIARDPGRLSRGWRDGLRAAGLDDGHYVELIGVVVTVVSIDAFCNAIGAALHPLPTPVDGEPSQYRPMQARDGDAWVPMIPAFRASGAESDLWRRGITGNVIRALSLVPDEVRTLKDLSAAHYLRDEQVADPRAHLEHLTRPQMELLAGRVSALRECFY